MAEQEAESPETGQTAKAGIDMVRVHAWLQEKWTADATCPVSGDNDWQVAEELVQPMLYAEHGLTIGGPGYPLVMVVCRACGYTVFFNATVMGVEGSGGDD